MKYSCTIAVIGLLIASTFANPFKARQDEDEDVKIQHPDFGQNCTCLTGDISPGITKFNESLKILKNRASEDCEAEGSDNLNDPKCNNMIPEEDNIGLPQIVMCGNQGKVSCDTLATVLEQLVTNHCDKVIEDKTRIAGSCWVKTDVKEGGTFVQVGRKIT